MCVQMMAERSAYFSSISSTHASTGAGALHSRCSTTNFIPPASKSWQLSALPAQTVFPFAFT